MDKRFFALVLIALIAISTIATVTAAFPSFIPDLPTLHTFLADVFSEYAPQAGDPVGGGGFP